LDILTKARAFLSTTTKSSCFKRPGVYPGLFQKHALYDVTAGGIVGWGGPLAQKVGKIAAVHATAWYFNDEEWVKINFLFNIMKRAWTKVYNAFENFKISLLLTQI
jgi:hypothetical protein